MTDYADRLEKMQGEYDDAKAQTSAGAIPDGDYEGLIERFDFWEKEGGGPLKLITEISVQQGELAGHSAPNVWHELEDPDRIGWTKGYLEMLGLEGVDLAKLPEALEPLAGVCRVGFRVVSTKKEGKVYTNVYVNEVLEGEGPSVVPSEFASAAVGKDDDISF